MGGMLRQLQSHLADLKPEAILPDSIFTPRQELVDIEMELQEEPKICFDRDEDCFTVNPLAVLFKRSNLPEGACGAEDESEDSDADDEDEEPQGDLEQVAASGSGEELELGSEDEMPLEREEGEETQLMIEYILNIGFGNEDLASAARLTLVAPERLSPVLDWLCACQYGGKPFRVADLQRADTAASSDKLKEGIVEGVLQILLTHGFLVRQ